MKHRFESSAPLWLSALTLLLAPSASFAQSATENAASTQGFESEFEALLQRVGAAQNSYYAEMRALYSKFDKDKATAEEQAAFDKQVSELQAKDPSAAYVREFSELATRAKGTEVGAKAWMQVLQLGESIEGKDSPCARALETLLADHLASPALADLPMSLLYTRSLERKVRVDALQKLADGSPVDTVKGEALYSLGAMLTDEKSTPEERSRGRKAFGQLAERFGSVASPTRGSTYGQLVEKSLFELDHLQLGMQIPDFEAVDEAGAKFKLSDYKGKVVVVDFWGFW
jgi:hypothetical protein